MSPLPVCFLSRAGLIPMWVCNGVRDAPQGKFRVAAPSFCEEDQQLHRDEGGQAPGSRSVAAVKVKMNFCTEEESPSLAQWGRSCLPPEDHGKSSAGSSELILPCRSCHKSTCSDLPVAAAVRSIENHGKAVSCEL